MRIPNVSAIVDGRPGRQTHHPTLRCGDPARQMSPERLAEGLQWAYRTFYGAAALTRRFGAHASPPRSSPGVEKGLYVYALRSSALLEEDANCYGDRRARTASQFAKLSLDHNSLWAHWIA